MRCPASEMLTPKSEAIKGNIPIITNSVTPNPNVPNANVINAFFMMLSSFSNEFFCEKRAKLAIVRRYFKILHRFNLNRALKRRCEYQNSHTSLIFNCCDLNRHRILLLIHLCALRQLVRSSFVALPTAEHCTPIRRIRHSV